jgi:hypothetical protein
MQKSFLEMARGAFMERADYEIAKVVDNVRDANTNPTAKRKITLTATFAPDANRENIMVSFEAKTALAPTVPVTTALYIAGQDSDGIPQVVEMTPQVPGQLDIAGGEQEAPPMLRIVRA